MGLYVAGGRQGVMGGRQDTGPLGGTKGGAHIWLYRFQLRQTRFSILSLRFLSCR